MQLLLLAALAGVLLLWFLPVHLTLQLRQHDWQATLWAQVKVLWWRISRGVNLTDEAAKALERMLTRRTRSAEDERRNAARSTRRRPPVKRMARVASRPLRYLLRRTRCRLLTVEAVVGGGDAMESALLAGAVYAAVGAGMSQLARWIRLRPSTHRTTITPVFDSRVWRLRLDCILALRLGHAIVAGIWLLRRAARDRELKAWAREHWRSKGVEGSVGASDSRPDENGDGEPEGHGGRQHGHR